MSTAAQAHPNIALVKYWGKQDVAGNLPAAPSLSITLDTLTTTTQVAVTTSKDRIYLNDKEVDDEKITRCLSALRTSYGIPHLEVRTQNNFPTAAGLASSASGFAALVTAVNSECELELDPPALSDLARRASGSAARSIFGGFVALEGPGWQARQILGPDEWPLQTIVAITATDRKSTPSSTGMSLSRDTSPFYASWVSSTHADFQRGKECIAEHDFSALATLAESSCLKMHAVMLSSNPALIYWNAATLSCIHKVRELRAAGLAVFFTVDAGPQVKAVCLPDAAKTVQEALEAIPGVRQVLCTGIGPDAHIVTQ